MTMNKNQIEKSIDLATEGFDAVKNKMLEAETEEDMLISVHALDLMFSAAIIRKDIGFFQTVKKEVGGVIRHFSKNDKKRLVGRLEAMENISYLLAGSIPNRKKVDFVKSGRLRDKIALILHRKASLYMSELQKELTKEMGYDVSMSSLSQIIKRMVDNDIVHTAKEGNKTFCRLTVEGELVAQELSEPLLHADKFEEILQNVSRHPDADVLDLSIKLGVPDEIVQRVMGVYSSNIPSIDYQGLEEVVKDIQTNIKDIRIRMGRLECEIPRSALEIKKRHEDIQELVAHTFDYFPEMKRVDKAYWNDSENLLLGGVPTLEKERSDIMRQKYQSSEGVPHKAPTAQIQGKSKYEDCNRSYV
jgi:DNA-binding PadR family transcriptional regulator